MEEFVVVKYRHRKQSKKISIKPNISEYNGAPISELCQKIKLAKCNIRSTHFFQQFLRLMESLCVDGHVFFNELICYGIGHVGMCQVALHQAALLLAMVDEWKPAHTWVFDPVLHAEETNALQASGLEIIPENEVSLSLTILPKMFFVRLAGEQSKPEL